MLLKHMTKRSKKNVSFVDLYALEKNQKEPSKKNIRRLFLAKKQCCWH